MHPDVSRYCAQVLNTMPPPEADDYPSAEALHAAYRQRWDQQEQIRAAARAATSLADLPTWLFELGDMLGVPRPAPRPTPQAQQAQGVTPGALP